MISRLPALHVFVAGCIIFCGSCQAASSKSAKVDFLHSVAASTFAHHQVKLNGAKTSKGIGLSYVQVTHGLVDKFNMKDGIPVNGRRASEGQDGYKGPAIEVIGDHNDIWEAGLVVGMPKNVPSEIAMANAGSLLLFIKNVAPHWNSSVNWLEAAQKQAARNPGSKITATHYGIKYTVLYVAASSATFVTAKRTDAKTDDIIDAIK